MANMADNTPREIARLVLQLYQYLDNQPYKVIDDTENEIGLVICQKSRRLLDYLDRPGDTGSQTTQPLRSPLPTLGRNRHPLPRPEEAFGAQISRVGDQSSDDEGGVIRQQIGR